MICIRKDSFCECLDEHDLSATTGLNVVRVQSNDVKLTGMPLTELWCCFVEIHPDTMKILFWFSFLFVGYTCAGYPVLLYVWSKLFPRKIKKAYVHPAPFVSVVIAARDEEKNIKSRIENLFAQEYPSDSVEIIIISDGSIDKTPSIVRDFVEQNCGSGKRTGNHMRVKLIELNKNQGKASALNLGVKKAKGEIIIFSDARQKFVKNAIKELVANFNDPSVGSVSGELKFYEKDDSTFKDEMNTYWDYEKKIRKMESRIHSTIGAVGAIYAVRKSLFRPLPEETLLDDVFTPMNIVIEGSRNIFDSEAVAYDVISKDANQEKRRKIRTLVGNYQLVKLMPKVISPVKNPVWFRYLSHKLFRLFTPFLFFSMVLSAFMSTGFLYRLVMIVCLLVILLAVLGAKLFYIPFLGKISKLTRTAVTLNYFAVLSLFYVIFRRDRNIW
jgi:cellulose synthase/poly-beta-1,6-N-acetylglucosamine synthase-like glycosyltransferase